MPTLTNAEVGNVASTTGPFASVLGPASEAFYVQGRGL